MPGKRYHVIPDDGDWKVKAEKSQKASAVFEDKDEAVDRGIELAKQEKSQLFIHKSDGTFQEERTYRKDPHPPGG